MRRAATTGGREELRNRPEDWKVWPFERNTPARDDVAGIEFDLDVFACFAHFHLPADE